ncbi:MAG: nitroreductase family protein [Betaproteobacteria bacterium]|nr:nitroreductase family protein [Betaproteobacteria bacterium]
MARAAGSLAVTLAYHERSKHRLDRYAAGPGALDWEAQPNPFRCWNWTQHINLPRQPVELPVPWAALNAERPAAPLTLANLGTLLRLALAITAWKSYAGDKWALRAHPSSGNLHPTEAYVIAHWVEGLADGLYHYQARHHCLEWRAGEGDLSEQPGLWLGLSSIHWREAWKYGERAFRYCQLDLGHVLAAVSYAAALLGWRPRLLACGPAQVAATLGLDRADDFAGVEAEEPDVLLAIELPGSATAAPPQAWGEWSGAPSLLDPKPMYHWPVIDEVAEATRGAFHPSPLCPSGCASGGGAGGEGSATTRSLIVDPIQECPLPNLYALQGAPPLAGEGVVALPATQVILKRRSAQAFDGQSVMPLAVFRRLLAALLPGGSPVWSLWPRSARVHPVVLVHRVEGLVNGLYILPRSEAAVPALREALRSNFEWQPADAELPLYRLVAARCGKTARTVSCHQDIAAQSALTFMMLAEFEGPLAEDAVAYRHLHWEAGMLGHAATLEAEAAGWRGTGIGCFFDDADHELLGLADRRYQVIYHYAIGMAVDDPRLSTLPAYD